MNSSLIKLNLGCGDKKIHGFVNVDGREDTNPDVVCDLSEISKRFSDVDLIYACHVLEHFPKTANSFYKTTYSALLRDWHSSLRTGGTLRLSVPDMQSVFERYSHTKNLKEVMSFLYGGQKYDFDFHFCGWDFPTLREELESVGFKSVRIYDWRKTEHSFVDDYSQAYLPSMEKISGKLMSLNVEAIK